MSKKVVTFGEIMLRLSPPGYQRIVQAQQFDVNYGGGEANVAISLANYGLDSYYVTRLPNHEIGQAAVNALRRFGVKTDYILRGGDRIGIYFLEIGASQRASKVIYDRSNSAIAQITPEMIDWETVFTNAAWFHFTGITPALSDSAAQTCLKAVKVAKENNLTVSCDLNYRKKLWSPDKANRVMTELMDFVDIAIGNEEDAEKVFGIKAPGVDVTTGELNPDAYQPVAEELVNRFKFQKVAITLRQSISASDNIWSGVFYDGKQFYTSRRYNIHIVDRVGGGDAFAAGLIYALLDNRDPQEVLDFAVAASCLKHTLPGDFNHVSVREIEVLLSGNVSGRVQR
ncbi:sugar kinase [candidate division KSB1 bacterium]|nr:MAG: 2-dehydro-3-deoxygluconokinase [candidate division KSB1 bacterium 4484_219]RKY78790.1 MAG: sugar kinase [candidate division KSB1 bacterium]RKY80191.1 MAG: sugar kinase [candidate division KSB1 bacterium]RKY82153.1 MAG: sugar kinase [candidate division KSB1 bacterium]RKY89304.1 MAG: sugar kinase [candidate division KSB1 bacterium]